MQTVKTIACLLGLKFSYEFVRACFYNLPLYSNSSCRSKGIIVFSNFISEICNSVIIKGNCRVSSVELTVAFDGEEIGSKAGGEIIYKWQGGRGSGKLNEIDSESRYVFAER